MAHTHSQLSLLLSLNELYLALLVYHLVPLTPILTRPQAYVFMVGGGNYIEYQNLQDYCRRQGTRQITYGTSELMNARQFLAQVRH